MGDGIDVIELARTAYRAEDVERLATLIADHPLELWFGMPRSEFHILLRAVPRSVARYTPAVAAMLRGFDSERVSSHVDLASHADKRTRDAFSFITAGKARLSGDPVTSFQMMRGLSLVTEVVPQLVDSTRGQRSFVLLQSAISGMLAGRFAEALALFEKSLIPPVPSPLAFFARDAHVRSAMIHALYGDVQPARLHLHRASQVPRTTSWAEDHLDSDERLVRALLAPERDAATMFEDLSNLPVSQMGEMWPFHVEGVYRLALAAGKRSDGRARVEQLRATDLIPPRGSGYAGSVFGVTLALDSLLAGVPGRAREYLGAADQRFWLTKLMTALDPALSPAKAVRLGRAVSGQTQGLAGAEARRLVTLAIAHHRRGDTPTALRKLSMRVGPRSRVDILLLHALAPDLAPRISADGSDPRWGPSDDPPIQLSAREFDVLELLEKGLRRAEIAERLFLSTNTVKSHQRTVYRKLGVSRAADAILEARRRGLI